MARRRPIKAPRTSTSYDQMQKNIKPGVKKSLKKAGPRKRKK